MMSEIFLYQPQFIGIGPNTLIAKIASDWSKPMGQFEVPRSREAVNEFMAQMPVRKVNFSLFISPARFPCFFCIQLKVL